MLMDLFIHHTAMACWAIGLPVDKAEWKICLGYAFTSSFEPLTVVFSTILAFC